jgi:mono/diheme cytochrome c family protein
MMQNQIIAKKTVINFLFLISIFILVGLNKIFSVAPIAQIEEWIAPPEANKIINPFAGDKKSVGAGKALYSTYCVPCHGEKGKGDGPASTSIKTKPADHTSGKIQKQSDGAIFWKLTEGRPALDMVSYKLVLSDNERWSIVNYIRTLSEK